MVKAAAELLCFPDEAISHLSKQYNTLIRHTECEIALKIAATEFINGDGNEYTEKLDHISTTLGIPRYTVDMLMLLLTVEPTRDKYRERGLPDSVCRDTMSDLKNKLIECYNVYGCWGTFVTWWFRCHTQLRLFTLGRLQYEPIAFPYDSYKGVLKKGDTVYNCHIPSGGALSEESVLYSFRRAYDFFEAKGMFPIYCNSWLIYPPTAALYGENSNLRRFYEMYDIINAVEDDRMKNFWHIFDTPYSREALENASEDNSLRRAFKKYLLEGGSMGNGQGIILFDGENIIK